MTNFEKILIDSLSHFAIDKDFNVPMDGDTAKELVALSQKHKCLDMFFYVNRNSLKEAMPPEKYSLLSKKVLFDCTLQLSSESELVVMCNKLSKGNVRYAVFKGTSVRKLYPKGEYRTSSDEDVLVFYDDFERAKQIFISSGYRVLSDNNGEIKLAKPGSGTLFELHSGIVSEKGKNAKQINSLFSDCLADGKTVDICSGLVKTFDSTYLFLILLLHFYNHFVMGGIGIRPLLDIYVMLERCSDEIEFSFVEKVMRSLSAENLYKTVTKLCKSLFSLGCAHEITDTVSQMLLDDIFSSGAYGSSDSSRVHSGTFVKYLTVSQHGTDSGTDNGNPLSFTFFAFFSRLMRFIKIKNKHKIFQLVLQRRRLMRRLGLR